MGSNSLSNLIPTMYAALDVVSRELIGFIPAVSRNSGVERAALNQTVDVPITQPSSVGDNTPAVIPPDTGDQTVGTVPITISKSKHYPIRWNGEDTKGMQNAGTYGKTLKDQFVQGFRTLTNLIETDVATSYSAASRAYGTAGTAPFGTAGDLSDIAGVRQILDDNGAPQTDLQLVLGSGAMANLRGKQNVLFKVNEAGTEQLLREGIIGRLEGFDIRNSGQVAAVTKGTGASYLVNNAAAAIGDTTIPADTGSGTILAGDVVTIAGDSVNKYVVGSPLAGGSFSLNKPGARTAFADNSAITVGNSFRANLAFVRSAIILATRMPAMPDGGDSADDRTTLIDPASGLAFEVAVYRQFLQVTYHIRIAWGWKPIKPEHIALLLG